MNRAYILSLVLLGLFSIMVIRLSLADFPSLQIIASVLIFFGGITLLVYKLRKKINTKPEESGSGFLPPLLRQSRTLQILFATVAIALIVSVLVLPVFLIFFSIDQILNYIENYFFYQLTLLGVFFLPFVFKRLK